MDQFFASGGTIQELERLVQDDFHESVSVDDLLLDWALERAERPVDTFGAQHQRADGVLVYEVPLGDRLALIASDGSLRLLEANHRPPIRATLSVEGIRRFRYGHHTKLADVIEQVHRWLIAHISFAEDWQSWMVSLWVAGTYLHVLFAFFGYLHITSPW